MPVQIAARLKNGGEVYQLGEAVLHRTGVHGATAEQRRWRLRTITLRSTKVTGARP